MRQLSGRAGLMLTARNSASVARERVLERDIAKATLLVQETEAWLQLFQLFQCRQRVRGPSQMPLARGGNQMQIPIFGQQFEQQVLRRLAAASSCRPAR